MKSEITCPHCKKKLEINWKLNKIGHKHKYQCVMCKLYFYYTPHTRDLIVEFLGTIIGLAIIIGFCWLMFFIGSGIYHIFNDDTQSINQPDKITQSSQNKNQEISEQINKLQEQISERQKEEKNMIKQYTSKVLFNNENFRTFAKQISSDCYGSQECQLTKIYFYIIDNFEYYSDQRSFENIQSPIETWNSNGGDCEDLGILLQTLLESIGIKTYSVFTTNHYFVLGCVNNASIVHELSNKIYSDKFNKYYKNITYYNLDNLQCIPLEPTTSKTGFPGITTYSCSEAYDSLTLEKHTLT